VFNPDVSWLYSLSSYSVQLYLNRRWLSSGLQSRVVWYITRITKVLAASSIRTISAEDGRNKHLWNVSKLSDCTALLPGKQPSTYSPPWEPEILLQLNCFIQVRFLWYLITSLRHHALIALFRNLNCSFTIFSYRPHFIFTQNGGNKLGAF
jgi:hypothetical protein